MMMTTVIGLEVCEGQSRHVERMGAGAHDLRHTCVMLCRKSGEVPSGALVLPDDRTLSGAEARDRDRGER